VVALVKAGLAALQGLLDHGAPQLVFFRALLEQVLDRFHDLLEGLLRPSFLAALGRLFFGLGPGFPVLVLAGIALLRRRLAALDAAIRSS